LGWADENDPVNNLIAEREPIDAFATFHGFEDDGGAVASEVRPRS